MLQKMLVEASKKDLPGGVLCSFFCHEGNSSHEERMKMWASPVKAEQPGNSAESILTFNLAATFQVFDAFFLQGEQTDSIALTVLSGRVCDFFPASLQKGDTDGDISFFLIFITLPVSATSFPKCPCCTCHVFSAPISFY